MIRYWFWSRCESKWMPEETVAKGHGRMSVESLFEVWRRSNTPVAIEYIGKGWRTK